MKRLAIFLGGILVLPAYAEVAPVFYEDVSEYVDGEYYGDEFIVDEGLVTETVAPTKAPVKISRQMSAARNSANRATASRATPATSTHVSGRGTTAGTNRALTSRTTATPRTATTRGTSARTTTARTGATRTAGGAGRSTTARNATGTSSPARVSVRSDVVSAMPATTTNSVQYTSITGTGDTLYNPNRVGVRGVGTTQRSPVIRVATTGITTDTSVATSTADMDELAELTDYCKAQYAACMDNYCNVLDDNQGRCSCSSNLKNYAKAEAALKAATEELQDVAQKIQYIGLSAREVESLFSQTEAEWSMQSKTDNSQLKTSLDKIKNMIIDVKSGNGTSSSTSGLSFDLSGLLDFTIDSTGFDLSSFLTGFSSNSDVTNQRGVELYKSATNRCKTSVLKACTANGVDASLITNAYDLEIDRECIAYERSLNDSNSQMTATIRNAQSVLQKARLLVAQSKNEYGTMRECVNALDACMQDDFVCGSDYENCLDPTGRYIVNGAIVIGSQPGHVIDPSNTLTGSTINSNICNINLYRTWDFGTNSCSGSYAVGTDQGNAWGVGANDTLANYIENTVTSTSAQTPSTNMSEYLQNKIGYVDNSDATNHGMCVSVLNKCQDYTYDGRGTNAQYNPRNDVIKQYLARVLVQIKSKQDEILADYAASCIADVNSCLAQNNYPTDEPVNSDNTLNWNNAERTQANIAVNACRSQIVTCMSANGYSIDTPTPTEMNCWVMGLQFNTTTSECTPVINGNNSGSGGGAGGGTTPTTYTLTYSCGTGCSGTKPSAQSNITSGTTVTLATSCANTSAGQSIASWSCTTGGTTIGKTQVKVTGNTMCTATCTTTTPTYTISYDCGSGTGTAPSDQTVQAGSSYTTAANSCIAPDSNIFYKWKVYGTGTTLEQSYTYSSYNYGGDIRLVAQWQTSGNSGGGSDKDEGGTSGGGNTSNTGGGISTSD